MLKKILRKIKNRKVVNTIVFNSLEDLGTFEAEVKTWNKKLYVINVDKDFKMPNVMIECPKPMWDAICSKFNLTHEQLFLWSKDEG